MMTKQQLMEEIKKIEREVEAVKKKAANAHNSASEMIRIGQKYQEKQTELNLLYRILGTHYIRD